MAIVRIVKMEFKDSGVEEFKKIFERSISGIKSFGCRDVQLFHNAKELNQLFTISFWEKEEDLENYRSSDFFQTTWVDVKKLFQGKPEAWTLKQ